MLAAIVRERDLELAGLGGEAAQDLPLGKLREQFVADLRSRCTPRYVERAESSLSRWEVALRVRSVRELKPEAVLRQRRARLTAGVSNRTVNLEVTVLKTMLNWGVKTGLISVNPVAAVPMLPQGKAHQVSERRALTDEEIAALIEASRALDAEGQARAGASRTIEKGSKGIAYAAKARVPRVPQTPLWLTLLETGGRLGETVATTWGDLDEQRGALTFRAKTTKSKRERTVPLRGSLVAELRALKLIHHRVYGRLPLASEAIFLTPQGQTWKDARRNALRMLRKTLDAAGVERVDESGRKVDIHALRHTFASRLARAGVPLQKAQRLLGHSDPKLTASIYTHLETEDLREAVESLPEVVVAVPHRAGEGRKTPLPTEGDVVAYESDGGSSLAPTGSDGTPGGIRTHDPRFRKPVLYPAELRARCLGKVTDGSGGCTSRS